MRKRRIVFGASISLRKVISQLQDGKYSLGDGDYTDNLTKMEENLQKALDNGHKECPGGCGVKDATMFCNTSCEFVAIQPSGYLSRPRTSPVD